MPTESATGADDGERIEKAPTRSANLVMLWLLIPLAAILIYGLLDR